MKKTALGANYTGRLGIGQQRKHGESGSAAVHHQGGQPQKAQGSSGRFGHQQFSLEFHGFYAEERTVRLIRLTGKNGKIQGLPGLQFNRGVKSQRSRRAVLPAIGCKGNGCRHFLAPDGYRQ